MLKPLLNCLSYYMAKQTWGVYWCAMYTIFLCSQAEPWEQLLNGIIGGLDELPNSSLFSLLCLVYLQLSKNIIILHNTLFKSI